MGVFQQPVRALSVFYQMGESLSSNFGKPSKRRLHGTSLTESAGSAKNRCSIRSRPNDRPKAFVPKREKSAVNRLGFPLVRIWFKRRFRTYLGRLAASAAWGRFSKTFSLWPHPVHNHEPQTPSRPPNRIVHPIHILVCAGSCSPLIPPQNCLVTNRYHSHS